MWDEHQVVNPREVVFLGFLITHQLRNKPETTVFIWTDTRVMGGDVEYRRVISRVLPNDEKRSDMIEIYTFVRIHEWRKQKGYISTISRSNTVDVL